MIVRRVGLSLRRWCVFSLQRLAPFCTSSHDHPRFSSFYSDDKRDGSAVYRQALKSQRPMTLKWQPQLNNSISFIGSVVRPIKIYKTRNNKFGVYTFLHVKDPHSNGGFHMLLEMWDYMAETCREHLKQNDFIYVSGPLESYAKVDENGKLCLRYKVVVKDLNYVVERGSLESKFRGGEAGMEKHENRLYLWHVYFANPYDWWDNRKNKLFPGSPDFKHKDTGEVLWVDPNDPPWIKKQLQRMDSLMAEQSLGGHLGSRYRVSKWVYDE